MPPLPKPAEPHQPARRRPAVGRRWWWAGLGVLALVGLTTQEPATLMRTLGGSLLPVLAGCVWVLTSSDWPS